jgi:hypothetical protein
VTPRLAAPARPGPSADYSSAAMARIGRRRRTRETRWDAENRLVLNPGPFLALGGLVAVLVGLAVLLRLV